MTNEGTEEETHTPVFVKGSGHDASSNYSAGTLVSKLSALEADDIYCDAETYASNPELILCPNSEAPALATGSAWSFTTEAGATLQQSDTVVACGTATPILSTSFDFATVELTTSSFTFDEQGGKDPGAYVCDATGAVVDPQNYTLSYYYGSTLSSATLLSGVDEICAYGTYWVVATGTGAYEGSCSTSFTVNLQASTWTRYVADGRIGRAASISTKAYSTFGASTTSMLLVVNADDYASCAIAVSLAGVLHCPIVTLEDDELNSYVISALASAKCALVLGNQDYISTALYEEIASRVTYPTRAFTSTCVNAIDESLAIYEFVSDCIAGDYLEAVWKGSFVYSTEAALVVPAEGAAAAFSAIAWASAQQMPLFFATSDGVLDIATRECLSEFSQVWVADFDAAGSAAITAACATSTCQVYEAQSSTYASSASYANAAMASDAISDSALIVVAPNDYGVMAAAAGCAATAGYALLLADGTDEGATTVYDFVEARRYELLTGYVCANYAEFPASQQAELNQLCAEASDSDLLFAKVELNATKFAYTGAAINCTYAVYAAVSGTLLVEGTKYEALFYDSVTCKTVAASDLREKGSYTLIVSGINQAVSIYTSGQGYTMENTAAAEFVIGTASVVEDYTASYEFVPLDESAYVEAEDNTDVDYNDDSVADAGADANESANEDVKANDDGAASGGADSTATQTIKAKSAKATVKAKAVKKKAKKCTFAISGAKTTLVAAGANAKSKKALSIKVNSKKKLTVTVKKKTKNGTYKVKVYAKAKSGAYSKSNVVTLTIKVK